MAEIDSIMQKKDRGWPHLGYKTKEDAILVRDRVHKFHQLETTVSPSRSRTVPATGEAQRDQQGGFRPRFLPQQRANVSSVVWTVSFQPMGHSVN